MKKIIDFKRIKKLSDIDRFEVSLYNKSLKLTEELGEATQAKLAYSSSKNSSNSLNEKDSVDVLMEELIDTINVAADIIFYLSPKQKIEISNDLVTIDNTLNMDIRVTKALSHLAVLNGSISADIISSYETKSKNDKKVYNESCVNACNEFISQAFAIIMQLGLENDKIKKMSDKKLDKWSKKQKKYK